MHEDSIKYTAFSTPDGHYEFEKLPFGLKILGNLDYVQIYLDDNTIHTNTIREHLNTIQVVIDKPMLSVLRLNAD